MAVDAQVPGSNGAAIGYLGITRRSALGAILWRRVVVVTMPQTAAVMSTARMAENVRFNPQASDRTAEVQRSKTIDQSVGVGSSCPH